MKRLLNITLLAFLVLNGSSELLAAGPKMFEIEEEANLNDPWYSKSRTDEENFKRLVSALKKIDTGKKVIEKATEKAAQQGQTLYDVIAIGNGSLTDTTLIRRFSASNPAHVVYETKSKVFLNRHLKTLDALLDFAHELTHYTYREAFNPYDSRFHLKDFIKSTVEGRGGEVDAYMVECKVLKELLPTTGFERSNCPKVYDNKLGSASRELGIQEFYKVGKHFEDLKKNLTKYAVNEKDLPQATNNEALFISSAWGLPYPIAAVREYVNIMDRVCKNDKNRITLLQEKLDRSPASATPASEALNYQMMFEDFKVRCDKFSMN